jgi:hypothetical protein
LWQGNRVNPTLFSQNLGDGCALDSITIGSAIFEIVGEI